MQDERELLFGLPKKNKNKKHPSWSATHSGAAEEEVVDEKNCVAAKVSDLLSTYLHRGMEAAMNSGNGSQKTDNPRVGREKKEEKKNRFG